MLALFFLFDTFPYMLRECALSKAGYYNENMLWEITRQMCLLEGRCPLRVPGSGTMWWPPVDTDLGLQGGLWAAWGSQGGEGTHWPLTIQLQMLALLPQGMRWTNLWSHLPWLPGPQSPLPSLMAVTDGNQGGELQALRKKSHCATKRLLSATATQPPSLGHRGTWHMLGLPGSEERASYRSSAWNCPVNAAEWHGCKGTEHCHLRNHYGQLLSSIWLMVPGFCLIIFGEFLC